MSKLIEKLSSKNRKIILREAEEHPDSWKFGIKKLTSEEHFINLPIIICSEIFSAIYPNEKFDLVKFYKLFYNGKNQI